MTVDQPSITEKADYWRVYLVVYKTLRNLNVFLKIYSLVQLEFWNNFIVLI